MFRCNRFARTTSASWSCAGVDGRSGLQGFGAAGQFPASDGRGHPWAAGAGLCHLAVDGSAAHRARRRAGVDQAAHAHPGELIGVATGPLTNLALALREEPALPALLRRLVIMGGAFEYRGNTTPVAEWNISVDPEAAQEVFAVWAAAWGLDRPRHLPIVLGLNLTENIAMTPALLGRLATEAGSPTAPMSVLDDRGTRSVAANPLIRVLEDAMRFYFEFHFDQDEGYLAHLHDPLAAAVALDPELVTVRPATVDVELTGTLTRGMTIADWSGRWGREPNALIGVDVDPAAFFDRFIARVGQFARDLA